MVVLPLDEFLLGVYDLHRLVLLVLFGRDFGRMEFEESFLLRSSVNSQKTINDVFLRIEYIFYRPYINFFSFINV